MRFYFVTKEWMNEEAFLSPRIPESMDENEPDDKLRVCLSPSVIGCVYSIISSLAVGDSLYVYHTDIPVESVYQPSYNEVYDVDITGEMWSFDPVIVHYLDKLRVDYIEETGFSRIPFMIGMHYEDMSV